METSLREPAGPQSNCHTHNHNPHDSAMSKCPQCGTEPSTTSILENEVRVLTQQSMEAANKLAAYELEIRHLRTQRAATAAAAATDGAGQQAHTHSVSVDEVGSRPTTLARFASFRMGRKTSATPSSNPSVDLGDLQTQLAREMAARIEAEKKCEQVHAELEDLSAQLFEQANEMVATERRARAKLEERIAVLEQRDKDKSRRLERIETGLKRLERVNTLLGT